MNPASLLRLLLVLVVVSVADFASAKTEVGASGPTPVLYKREVRFSRMYDPSIKPEREARPLRLAPLIYPQKWIKWGQPAYAVMAFLVDATGRPIEIQCVEATDRAFAKAAEKSIDSSRFMPALKNQQGVCSKIEHRVEFSLNAAGAAAPAAPATPTAPAALAAPGKP